MKSNWGIVGVVLGGTFFVLVLMWLMMRSRSTAAYVPSFLQPAVIGAGSSIGLSSLFGNPAPGVYNPALPSASYGGTVNFGGYPSTSTPGFIPAARGSDADVSAVAKGSYQLAQMGDSRANDPEAVRQLIAAGELDVR